MVREILIWPDPRLKEKSRPVRIFDEALEKLAADLFETMYAAEGVGLAAAQVGVHQRLLVIDTSPREENQKPLVFVNPGILAAEGTAEYTEGCLSVPGEYEDTGVRAERVTVRAKDVKGKTFTLNAEGLLAIAIQHEMDHLEGVLFVDYLSTLKRELIRRRMKQLKRDLAEGKLEDRAAPPSV